jgi:Secretion system C-terminal sorting domain
MKIWSLLTMLVLPVIAEAQAAILKADGPGNTYELINSILAPGAVAVENCECTTASGLTITTNLGHSSFGRHVAEVWDADLGAYVFEFYSHVEPDNDRCIAWDRQRVEIKTYEASPPVLIGYDKDMVKYTWRFKLPSGFQPSSSFTHIHQIKGVNGDDSDPIFTLTPRKGTPNKLELIYTLNATSGTTKPVIVNLSLFENTWVEATETIKIGAQGTYSIEIKRVSDDVVVLSYSNNNIQTIRPDNSFIRPKWGIYRSLNDKTSLRDESLRLNEVTISKLSTLPVNLVEFTASAAGNGVDVKWKTATETNTKDFIVERSTNGSVFNPLLTVAAAGNSATPIYYQTTDTKPLLGSNYYRLKTNSINSQVSYSNVVLVNFTPPMVSGLTIYPNPVVGQITINYPNPSELVQMQIMDVAGRQIILGGGNASQLNKQLNLQLVGLKPGVYFVKISGGQNSYFGKFFKQ